MKKINNLLAILIGILLALIIIKSQINQQRRHLEPMSKEERQNLYQQYLDYERGE